MATNNTYETHFIVLAVAGGGLLGWLYLIYLMFLLYLKNLFEKMKKTTKSGMMRFIWDFVHILIGLAGVAGSFAFIIPPLLVLPNIKIFPSYVTIYLVFFTIGFGFNFYKYRDMFLTKK